MRNSFALVLLKLKRYLELINENVNFEEPEGEPIAAKGYKSCTLLSNRNTIKSTTPNL